MTAKQILSSQFDEMTEMLAKTVSFDTVKVDPAPGAPFGTSVKDCLDYVLGEAARFGLSVYDCDGYAGHADFTGSGKETVGILGHLDVVPAKPEEWKYPPFSGTVADGKMYGRGTMDDKGPMIACLYAVKALKESGFRPKKTIRLIFGCDEESGMQCVEYYFSKNKYPDVSFSPDGDFPVINREKGIYQFRVDCGLLPEGVSVFAGERANVVPSLCRAEISADADFSSAALFGIEARSENGLTILTATGKSAHGSTPDEGENAAHKIFSFLKTVYPENQTIAFVCDKMSDTSGKRWGIGLEDEVSGKLTCNLGVFRTENGRLSVTADIRYPVTFTRGHLESLLRKNTPFPIVPEHVSDPLYVPSDNEPVTTLINVYNGVMNANCSPIAIGGGTYSRCLPNCVAFGPLFPEETQTIHMPNENIDLENLRLMSEIYLEAIRKLAE